MMKQMRLKSFTSRNSMIISTKWDKTMAADQMKRIWKDQHSKMTPEAVVTAQNMNPMMMILSDYN